jgi:hypothetical protein
MAGGVLERLKVVEFLLLVEEELLLLFGGESGRGGLWLVECGLTWNGDESGFWGIRDEGGFWGFVKSLLST